MYSTKTIAFSRLGCPLGASPPPLPVIDRTGGLTSGCSPPLILNSSDMCFEIYFGKRSTYVLKLYSIAGVVVFDQTDPGLCGTHCVLGRTIE